MTTISITLRDDQVAALRFQGEQACLCLEEYLARCVGEILDRSAEDSRRAAGRIPGKHAELCRRLAARGPSCFLCL